MCLALSRAGYDVVEACDGVEALERASQQRFDAAFLDIIMPRKEGLQTLIELRKFKHLKIIAMSGGGRLTSTNYLQVAAMSGACATLHKPFRMSQAAGLLWRVLAAPEYNNSITAA
jgi:DNA-binding response OmpR family regulator